MANDSRSSTPAKKKLPKAMFAKRSDDEANVDKPWMGEEIGKKMGALKEKLLAKKEKKALNRSSFEIVDKER